MRSADWVWFGEGTLASAVRTALAPCSLLFRAGVAARNAAFDRGLLRAEGGAIPALSVGNLSVGGTGKTPAAAWIASQLRLRGARPAVVLRGVGGDEPEVHRLLNPGIPVIVDPDRVRGIAAAHGSGCDVAVLDDAFQHRRARRLEDVVLVSADRWREPIRLLPAGPWREPVASLSRCTLLIVTRKAAPPEAARAVRGALAGRLRGGAAAIASIQPDRLYDAATGAPRDLSALAGRRVLAVGGVADPSAFSAQLRQAGADATLLAFADHHRYSAADVAAVLARAGAYDFVVCTLKDAVKLRSLWPHPAPVLWYVSQRFEIEEGGADVTSHLARVLAARITPTD